MNFRINLKILLPVLLIISTIFSHLLFLPKIGYKIQLTEIVFVLLSLFIFAQRRIAFDWKLTTVDKVFFLFGFILVLNILVHPESIVLSNAIGFFYLVLLYFVVSKSLVGLEYEEVRLLLKNSADYGFWILIGIGFIGFFIYYLFGYSKFVLIYHNYPYFGDVFRVKGFSYSPNLYISLLSFFTILKLLFSKLKYYHIVLVFFIAIISLTKEALLLSAVLFAIILYKNKITQKLGIISIIFAGLLYVFLSFFIISGKSDTGLNVLTNEAIYQKDNIKIYPTTYFEVFKSGVLMTIESPVKGVGLGKFRQKLDNYKEMGIYPKYFQTYDPLDSYTGLSSQLGVQYLLFLILLIAVIFTKIRKIDFSKSYPFILYFLYMIFESVALGTYHFRHYMIYLAIFMVYYEIKKTKPRSVA